MILCPVSADESLVTMIADFWRHKGVEVLATTPERHDRDTVYSLGFTHSLARLIQEMDVSKIELTTRSFNDVTEVARLSLKDTDQLFHDMLFYNPYFKTMKREFEQSVKTLRAQLDEIEQEQDKLLT
jgi:prephenate dehydrogenase